MNNPGETIPGNYPRIRIRTTLVTDSPLHCGDGDTLEPADWRGDKPLGADAGRINSVFRDHRGRACIPAATLRGSLRARANDPKLDPPLFGQANGDQGSIGKLRVQDAPLTLSPAPGGDLLHHPASGTSLLTGVSLNPITGTAADGKLFTHQVVPAGSCFELVLEADDVSDTELARLLTLLAGWDSNAASAIGRGRTHGWGRLRQQPNSCTLEVLSTAALREWMTQDAAEPLPWRAQALPEFAPPQPAAIELGFILLPQSPLLVNQPGRVSDKEGDPKLEFSRDANGNALLPGSSLRGALRARCQRILATIAHQRHEVPAAQAWQAVDGLVTALFGTERRASLLWFSDALADNTSEHKQTFIAVDRFTNGVLDSALYGVRAAACDQLQGRCGLANKTIANGDWRYGQSPSPQADENDSDRLPKGDWWKGLLLLLARDLLEGELSIGWGRSRGFGECHVRLDWQGQSISDFAGLLALLPDGAASDYLQALEQHIADTLRNCKDEVAA